MLEETVEALDTLVRTGKVRNLRTSELSLSPEETARLGEVSPQPLLYPHWHQANTGAGRLGTADLSLIAPHLANMKPRL